MLGIVIFAWAPVSEAINSQLCSTDRVCVQDVLSNAVGGSTMTVAEATNIADKALEHTVRTILAALQAPEILKSTSGLCSAVPLIQNA